jgi:hypothetical protein
MTRKLKGKTLRRLPERTKRHNKTFKEDLGTLEAENSGGRGRDEE